ncbi:MAG TPA: Fur family transcriptional regulator [Anaerolineales bacterium]|nr:Fur family transcriptional regulator [Anaerolineales bacterium]
MKKIFSFIMSNHTPTPLSQAWLDTLQAGGYRITRPLQVIVEILANSTRALGPVNIYDLARKEYPKTGLVTVYRALEKLEATGLVQRVHQADGCHAYLRAANGHEHILLCSLCGQVVYFAGDDLSDLIARVEGQSGFTIQEHWLQFHGLCANCQ